MSQDEFQSFISTGRVYKRNRSIQTESSFIRNNIYKPIEKVVYLYLVTYAEDRSQFPGLNKMAKDLGISKPTLTAALEQLENHGGVLVVNQITEAGRKTTNSYILAEIDQASGKFLENYFDEFKAFLDGPQVLKNVK